MRKSLITALLLSAASTVMAQTQQVTVVELHPAPGQFVNTMQTREPHTKRCVQLPPKAWPTKS